MSSKKQSSMPRDEYLKERACLIRLEQDAYKSFDKLLLTLSSGALTGTIVAVSKLEITKYFYLLISCWIFWMFSISCQLWSAYISPKALREEQRILNEQYRDYSKDPRENPYTGEPSFLSELSLVTFISGALLFLTQLALNLIQIK